MQHMDALRRANEVRLWLAEQHRQIESGDVELWCELCQDADVRLRSVTLIDYLQWLPGVGPTKARAIIKDVFPWPTVKTEMRRVAMLDLATALRLSEAARERASGGWIVRWAA